MGLRLFRDHVLESSIVNETAVEGNANALLAKRFVSATEAPAASLNIMSLAIAVHGDGAYGGDGHLVTHIVEARG